MKHDKPAKIDQCIIKAGLLLMAIVIVSFTLTSESLWEAAAGALVGLGLLIWREFIGSPHKSGDCPVCAKRAAEEEK